MGTVGVAPHEAGLAGGLLDAGRRCGGTVGLAALSTIAVAVTGTAGLPAPERPPLWRRGTGVPSRSQAASC